MLASALTVQVLGTFRLCLGVVALETKNVHQLSLKSVLSETPWLRESLCFSAIHKAAGLTVPGRSTVCLVLFLKVSISRE